MSLVPVRRVAYHEPMPLNVADIAGRRRTTVDASPATLAAAVQPSMTRSLERSKRRLVLALGR